MNVLKRKLEKDSQVESDTEPSAKRNFSKFTFVDKGDWRLTINKEEPWRSTICKISKGNSTLNEWHILPSAELGADEDWFGEIDPAKVSIAKHFMVICFKDKVLFVNLRSKKLFWIGQNVLDTKIE